MVPQRRIIEESGPSTGRPMTALFSPAFLLTASAFQQLKHALADKTFAGIYRWPGSTGRS